MSLPIAVTTLAATRQRVRELLAGRSDLRVQDAVQVTDELVSNACQHGYPPRTVRLTLTERGRRLHIEVDDASPTGPMLRPADRAGGFGLMLVDRLAASWGVQRHQRYKTVWAELVAAGPATRLTAVRDAAAT